MKKTIIFALTAGIISILLFASCAFGFEPAWKGKSGKATLSLQFTTIDSLARADSSDRAIIQGDGYLYIRTVGGPTSSSGPLYGPYHLTQDEKFETTEIPAGTYVNIAFLYVATNVDSAKAMYNGKEYTFRELMSLPDAEFNIITGGNNSETESPFDQILDGNASGKLYGKVTINEGTVNSLKMTMEPITGSKSSMTLWETNSLELTSDGKTLVRKFIRLEDYGNTTTGETAVTEGVFSLVPDANAVIEKITMFDELGNPLANFTEITETGGSRTFKFVRSSNTSYFIYLEFIATTLKINVLVESTNSSTLKIELLGDASVVGKRMFVGLHDSDITGNLIGTGILTVADDGNGSVTLYAVGSTEPIQVVTGFSYYLSGFIDVNNNYDDVTDLSAVSVTDYMTPHYGDYATPDQYVPITIIDPGMTYQILLSDLELSDAYVYFIATTAIGTENGQTPANANTLDSAITYANANALAFTQIFLTEPVTVMFSPLLPNISAEIAIASLSSTPQTLSVDPTQFFTLTAGANCTLYNVIVDGQNQARTNSLFTSIPMNAILNLSDDATITRCTAQYAGTNGGAVTVSGGTLYLAGGEISYCSATGSGGAIELGSGTVYLESGSIHDNSANYGGGIHVTDGNLTLTGTATINNNTAVYQGGGIFIENGASGPFEVSGVTPCITLNHVTTVDANCGAGVFINALSAVYDVFIQPGFVTDNTDAADTECNVYNAL